MNNKIEVTIVCHNCEKEFTFGEDMNIFEEKNALDKFLAVSFYSPTLVARWERFTGRLPIYLREEPFTKEEEVYLVERKFRIIKHYAENKKVLKGIGARTCIFCAVYRTCEECPLAKHSPSQGMCSGDDSLWKQVYLALDEGDWDAALIACDGMLALLLEMKKGLGIDVDGITPDSGEKEENDDAI